MKLSIFCTDGPRDGGIRYHGPLAFLKTALFGLLLLTASCTDKDKNVITPEEGSSLACVGKNLRLTGLAFNPAMDIDGDGKVDTDLLKYLPACSRDNTINFEKSGKLSGSEGASVCPRDDENPVSVEPSTWTYNAQTRIVRIVVNGDATDVSEWKVIDVSANLIKAAIVTESANGDKLDMIMTWQAQ